MSSPKRRGIPVSLASEQAMVGTPADITTVELITVSPKVGSDTAIICCVAKVKVFTSSHQLLLLILYPEKYNIHSKI